MAKTPPAPADRLHPLNKASLNSKGEYILYWMVAARRTESNFSLQHAIHLAEQSDCGLVVLEAIGLGHRWASVRFHQFVIDGMKETQAKLADTPICYLPYVEAEADAGKGLLEALAKKAVSIITDLFPCYFIPKMQAAVAKRLDVTFTAVDTLGLLPLNASPRVFTTAASFRRHMQKVVGPHMTRFPRENVTKDLSIPNVTPSKNILKQYRFLDPDEPIDISKLPVVDKEVGPAKLIGGAKSAASRLRAFMADGYLRYGQDRNHPDKDGASGLSPYLHFGHISTHTIMRKIIKAEGWSPDKAASKANGSRHGFWGMSEWAESFIDELITWREIGHVFAHHRPDHDQYDSLPEWALTTMEMHSSDERPYLYTLEQFENAQTHDDIWNAAQTQLVRDGVMHNYLRMLWAKKIYHWSATPREALEVMIELNNKYALDGRDPNSYSGIFWCLGRFDRAWGPEREIFGKLRYMTSDSTRKKLKLKNYLAKYSNAPAQQTLV